MSQKEAPRAGLLKALVAGRVTGGEAAALHLSARQVRRLRRRFEAEGAGGLLHRGLRALTPPEWQRSNANTATTSSVSRRADAHRCSVPRQFQLLTPA